jgi:hypothetical protein
MGRINSATPTRLVQLFTMAAKDVFHDAVIKGLEKEGWIITDDPLKLQVDGVDM